MNDSKVRVAVPQTGHVGLNVSDAGRSKDFYCSIFGLSVMGESTQADRRYVFLGEGDRLVLALWEQASEPFDGSRSGLHHLSFAVDDVAAVRRVEERVREAGAPLRFDHVVAHNEGAGSAAIFFEDPDGVRLEVFAPAAVGEHPAPNGEEPACGFF